MTFHKIKNNIKSRCNVSKIHHWLDDDDDDDDGDDDGDKEEDDDHDNNFNDDNKSDVKCQLPSAA